MAEREWLQYGPRNGATDQRRYNTAVFVVLRTERLLGNRPSPPALVELRKILEEGRLLTEDEFQRVGLGLAADLSAGQGTNVAGAQLVARMHFRRLHHERVQARLRLQETKAERELRAMHEKFKANRKMRKAREKEKEAWLATHAKGLALPK